MSPANRTRYRPTSMSIRYSRDRYRCEGALPNDSLPRLPGRRAHALLFAPAKLMHAAVLADSQQVARAEAVTTVVPWFSSRRKEGISK